jgi:hypothetical protein
MTGKKGRLKRMNKAKTLLIPCCIFLLVSLCGFLATQYAQQDAKAAGPGVVPVAHKAIYDFKLLSIHSGASLSGVEGELYFEQDNLCDAWATDHRFSATYYYPDQRGVKSTSHFITWEAKDASAFQFNSERSEADQPTEQLRGYIERKSGGDEKARDKAVYIRPSDLSYDLRNGYFLPTAHTMELIRHARRGDRFFNALVFDGTDADGPVEVNSFIAGPATAAEIDAMKQGIKDKSGAGLLTLPAWHVQMSAFVDSDAENMTPIYVMNYIQHENGIISDAVIDYGEFKVRQGLKSIEALPVHDCSSEQP